MTTRVLIGTTAGPAEVIKLKRQTRPGERPVICINGSIHKVAIWADYQPFVASPTGLVEGLYGHSNFRMDVSRNITSGDSWQLGALLAHALEAEGQLGQRQKEDTGPLPDTLVWATGQVRTIDLGIGPVGSVADKLINSIDTIQAAVNKGIKVRVFIPSENANDPDPSTVVQLLALGVSITTVSEVGSALAELDLSLPAEAASYRQEAEPSWTGNPYPGLQLYDQDRREVFFGRSKSREEALDRLQTQALRGTAFLLVHGRSGAGKSSFVRAGLAGDVAATAGGSWATTVIGAGFWSSEPVDDLAKALLAGTGLDGNEADVLAAGLKQAPRSAARKFAARPDWQGSVLLILDQFEQAVGQPQQAEELGRALRELAATGRIWVVATMRSDLRHLLDTSPSLARLAEAERSFRLDAPSLYELTDIVTRPAIASGYKFVSRTGDDLPAKLVALASKSPDSLPLLQVVLARLAALAGPDHVLSSENYERIGGFAGAVAKWAEDTVEEMLASGIAENAIDRTLAGLLRLDPETGTVLARPVALSQIVGVERFILDDFISDRLVSAEERDGKSTAQLAHETLITHWPRLAALAIRLRAGLELRDRIEVAATEWLASGRQDEDLLSNPRRAEEAEELVTDNLVRVSQNGLNFVDASRRYLSSAARDKAQKKQALVGVTAAVAVIFMGFSVFLFMLLRQAELTGAELAETTKTSMENAKAALAASAQAEELADAAVRRAALLTADAAFGLAEDGAVDQALSMMLDASASIDENSAPSAFFAKYDNILDVAARTDIKAIPADTSIFDGEDTVYIFAHDTGSILRFGKDARLIEILSGNGATTPVVALREFDNGARLRLVRDNGAVEDLDVVSGSLSFRGQVSFQSGGSQASWLSSAEVIITSDDLVIFDRGMSATDTTVISFLDLQTGKILRYSAPEMKRGLFYSPNPDGGGYFSDATLENIFRLTRVPDLSVSSVEVTDALTRNLTVRACLDDLDNYRSLELDAAVGRYIADKMLPPDKRYTNFVAGVARDNEPAAIECRLTTDEGWAGVVLFHVSRDQQLGGQTLVVIFEDGLVKDITRDLRGSFPDIQTLQGFPGRLSHVRAAEDLLLLTIGKETIGVGPRPPFPDLAAPVTFGSRLQSLTTPSSSLLTNAGVAVINAEAARISVAREELQIRPGLIESSTQTYGEIAPGLDEPRSFGIKPYYLGNCRWEFPVTEIVQEAELASGKTAAFKWTGEAGAIDVDNGDKVIPFPEDATCYAVSRNLHFIAIATDSAVRVYELNDVVSDMSFTALDFKSFNVKEVSSVFFIGDSSDLVVANNSNVVTTWSIGLGAEKWMKSEIYRSDYPIMYAQLDPSRQRLLITENRYNWGQGILYSIPARTVWHEFGEDFFWASLLFTSSLDIGFESRDSRQEAFFNTLRQPTLASYDAEAKQELSRWNLEHSSGDKILQRDNPPVADFGPQSTQSSVPIVRTTKSAEFAIPVAGQLVQTFEDNAVGVNISVAAGTVVGATASGTVLYAGSGVEGYGNLVIIEHEDSITSAYAHLERFVVKKGDVVLRNEAIGTVGQTGAVNFPQLHFELRSYAKPVDPMPFLKDSDQWLN